MQGHVGMRDRSPIGPGGGHSGIPRGAGPMGPGAGGYGGGSREHSRPGSAGTAQQGDGMRGGFVGSGGMHGPGLPPAGPFGMAGGMQGQQRRHGRPAGPPVCATDMAKLDAKVSA